MFVHGFPETSEVWGPLLKLIDRDAADVSLPGFGTARPDGFAGTKDAYADWLGQMLDRVDQPVDVVGHDVGVLLTLRVGSAYDLPLRSWTVDVANILHPRFAWPQRVRNLQNPGMGEDQDVLVGCRGGIGRTGTILGAIAIACGVPASTARAWVRNNYHPDAIETDEQHEWLMTISQDHRILRLAVETKKKEIHVIERKLRNEMWSVLHAGDPLPKLAWAIPGRLAITQRPLRAHPVYGGSGRDYPPASRPDIDAWIEDVVRQGIRSVIVLTSNKELEHYSAAVAADGGLLSAYRNAGLEVLHLPADDPAHDLTARAAFDAALDELSTEVARRLATLRAPSLLHCSAAIDRSPPVAARVAFQALLGTA